MANSNKNEKSENRTLITLQPMLQLLNKYGVTNAMLTREYGINRMSLRSIKMGKELPYAHRAYFTILLRQLNSQLNKTLNQRDVDRHREIKEKMFDFMLKELLG